MLHFGLLTKKAILPLAIKNKLLYDSTATAHTLPSTGSSSYTAIYNAVNDGSGFWYDGSGNPISHTLSEILAEIRTNTWNIWCSNNGRLMIFDKTLTEQETVKVSDYIGTTYHLGTLVLTPKTSLSAFKVIIQ